MSRLFFGMIIAAAFFASPLSANLKASEASAEAPQRPFNGNIPNRTSWVVNIEWPWLKNAKNSATSYEGKVLEKIEFSLQDGVRREILHYNKGEKLTRFIAGRMVLYVDPETGVPRLDDAQGSLSGSTYGTTRFAELGWINEELFNGEVLRDGRKYHVYKSQPSQEEGSSEEDMETEFSIPFGAVALIDAETNLPLQYSSRGTVWTYRFEEKFQPFVLPAELKDLIKQREAEIEEMKQLYNIPQ